MKNKCVVFVHPTLSVEFNFQLARERGYKIFAIKTSIDNYQIDTDRLKHQAEYFIEVTNDPSADIDKIKNYIFAENIQPVAFINGIDASLYYTDFLNKLFIDDDIDISSSKLRLNKFLVNQKLQAHAINSIRSLETSSKHYVQDNSHQLDQLGWPLIAKPSIDTAAMSQVVLVNNALELDSYFHRVIGSQNLYYKESLVKSIIMQSYVDPTLYKEYVVDFISNKGKHYNVGILEYKKIIFNGVALFRYYQPYCCEELPCAKELIAYVRSVLDALNVREGATHNELFFNPDSGEPLLIESNNRMAGNGINEIYKHAYGASALEMQLDIASGQKVQCLTGQRVSNCIAMDLYNHFCHHSTRIDILDLPSFKKVIHFRNKEKLPNNFCCQYNRASHISASVLLQHDDINVLNKDIAAIIDKEKSGKLFV